MVLPRINDRDELARLLASADALVHGCEAETFCMVAAEARASGTPMIVPDRGAAVDQLAPEEGPSIAGQRSLSGARDRRFIRRGPELQRAVAVRSRLVRTMDEHFADLFARYEELAPRHSVQVARIEPAERKRRSTCRCRGRRRSEADLARRLGRPRRCARIQGRSQSRKRHDTGCDSLCTLQIADGSISRVHSQIEPRVDGSYHLSDLSSRNGTYVNGIRVATVQLKDGDYVQLGECVYRFLAGGNVEAGYHDEIHRLSMLDPLTGVHNLVRSLGEFLDREVDLAFRSVRGLPRCS